jgi:hypothetical protein
MNSNQVRLSINKRLKIGLLGVLLSLSTAAQPVALGHLEAVTIKQAMADIARDAQHRKIVNGLTRATIGAAALYFIGQGLYKRVGSKQNSPSSNNNSQNVMTDNNNSQNVMTDNNNSQNVMTDNNNSQNVMIELNENLKKVIDHKEESSRVSFIAPAFLQTLIFAGSSLVGTAIQGFLHAHEALSCLVPFINAKTTLEGWKEQVRVYAARLSLAEERVYTQEALIEACNALIHDIALVLGYMHYRIGCFEQDKEQRCKVAQAQAIADYVQRLTNAFSDRMSLLMSSADSSTEQVILAVEEFVKKFDNEIKKFGILEYAHFYL